MNHAKLKALKLKFPIGNARYHDDGYVGSVILHTAQLQLGYGINPDIPNHWDFDDPMGRYYMYGENHHIFYLKSLPWVNIFTRAHEETHILMNFNRLDLLETKIREEQNRDLKLSKIHNEEIVANIGGIYALHSRMIPVWTLRLSPEFRYGKKNFQEAKELYKRSKIKQKY